MFHVGVPIKRRRKNTAKPCLPPSGICRDKKDKQEKVSTNQDDRKAQLGWRVNIKFKKKLSESGHNIVSYEILRNDFVRKNLWRSSSNLERALNQQSQELNSTPSSAIQLEKNDIYCVSSYLVKKEEIRLLWKTVWSFVTKLNILL